MADTVAKWINKYLAAICDTNDDIYKSLVANIDGVPEAIIDSPQDFNIGQIANTLEWIRQLSLSLINQLYIDRAEGKFLKLIAHDLIGIVKYENETDADYQARIQDFIIAHKVSRAAIIYYSIPFSSPGLPQLLDGVDDAAFADVSFSDVYTSFQNQQAGPEYNFWVFPAISASISSTAYFFILRLENTPDEDIAKVIDLVDRWKAGGISYEVQIVSV